MNINMSLLYLKMEGETIKLFLIFTYRNKKVMEKGI